MTNARSKLSVARRRYESSFHSEKSFLPVTSAGNFVYVDSPPRTLTRAERRETGRVDDYITEASRKLFPKSGGLYCAHSVTDTIVQVIWDAVTTNASIACVTRVPADYRALQSSTLTVGEADREATATEPATSVGRPSKSQESEKKRNERSPY